MTATITQTSSKVDRFALIDWLRAAAIVAVVVHHAAHFMNPPITKTDLTVFWMATFDVPVLFVLSGFLFARRVPVGASELGRRMWRVLPPYVTASLVMYFTGWSDVESMTAIPAALLQGSALFIYYFVFLLISFYILTSLLSFLPLAVTAAVVVGIWAYKILLVTDPWMVLSLDWFWAVRDPLQRYDFFLCGWLARAMGPKWLVRLRPILPRLGPAAAAICVLYAASRPRWGGLLPADRVTLVVYSFAVIASAAWIVHDRRVCTFCRWLSDSSYPIYLYHWPFVMTADRYLGDSPPTLRILVVTAAGLAGSAVIIATTAKLVPRYAHLLVGTQRAGTA